MAISCEVEKSKLLYVIGFNCNFVIGGFEEPVFKRKKTDKSVLNYENMPEIPPVLVIRMRLKN